nr:InlB B-repeat-containing protein [Candidatus Enterousia merdequi]
MKNIIKCCAIGCALMVVDGAYARPNSTGKTCSIEPNDGLCDGDTLLCPAGYYCPGYYQQIQCPEGKTSQAGATSEEECFYTDSVLMTFESDDTVNEETLKTSDDAVEVQTTAIYEPNTININWKDAEGNTFESTTCEYDGSIITPTTSPAKKGYTFTGWKRVDIDM